LDNLEWEIRNKEAARRLAAGDFKSENERQKLVHECFPYMLRSKGKGRLSVEYDEELDCIFVYDFGGFLTTVLTQTTLWEVVKAEFTNPGGLRLRVAGHNPWLEQKARVEAARVRRFTESGKPDITLEELGL